MTENQLRLYHSMCFNFVTQILLQITSSAKVQDNKLFKNVPESTSTRHCCCLPPLATAKLNVCLPHSRLIGTRISSRVLHFFKTFIHCGRYVNSPFVYTLGWPMIKSHVGHTYPGISPSCSPVRDINFSMPIDINYATS